MKEEVAEVREKSMAIEGNKKENPSKSGI